MTEREFLIAIRNDINHVIGQIALSSELEIISAKITDRLKQISQKEREAASRLNKV